MRIDLTTLSPVSVGSQVDPLQGADLVEAEGRIWVLDRIRLAREVAGRNMTEGFASMVSGPDPDVGAFLDSRGMRRAANLERLAVRTFPDLPQTGGRALRTIWPCARAVGGAPVLPATAIKGVIRTAVVRAILLRLDAADRDALLSPVLAALDPAVLPASGWPRERLRRTLGRQMEERILRAWSPSERLARSDGRTDLLRAVRVSDAWPEGAVESELWEVRSVSPEDREGRRRPPLVLEAVPRGVRFTATVTVDRDLLEAFVRTARPTVRGAAAEPETPRVPMALAAEVVADPLAAAREGASAQAAGLRGWLMEILGPGAAALVPDGAGLRAGRGGGLFAASVLEALDPAIGRDVRNRFHADRGDRPAPKTRRVAFREGRPAATMGWLGVASSSR